MPPAAKETMNTSPNALALDPGTPGFGELATVVSRQRNLVLATCRENRPYCSLMAHCVTPDLRTLVLASPEKSRKVDNILTNPAVSLLVTNQAEVTATASPVAVTITGVADIVLPGEIPDLAAMFLKKHPELTEFWSAPGTVAIRVAVSAYMQVRGFQEITEFIP